MTILNIDENRKQHSDFVCVDRYIKNIDIRQQRSDETSLQIVAMKENKK